MKSRYARCRSVKEWGNLTLQIAQVDKTLFSDYGNYNASDLFNLIMMQRLGDTNAFKDRNLRLHGADIATMRGWTGVPNFILENDQISVGAKLTYAMLLKYAREMENCFPGQDRLAKDMGNGVRSVVRYIAELEKVGLVTVQRRGQGRPNLYTIHLKASFWRRKKQPPSFGLNRLKRV